MKLIHLGCILSCRGDCPHRGYSFVGEPAFNSAPQVRNIGQLQRGSYFVGMNWLQTDSTYGTSEATI